MSSASVSPNGGEWVARYAEYSDLMLKARRACPGLPVLGISALRPRHLLPPDHVDLLTGRPIHQPSLGRIMGRWIRCVLFACREALLLAWLRVWFHRRMRRLMVDSAHIILRTWYFGPLDASAAQASTDFYYGTLPQQLEARGIRCLLLAGDIRGMPDWAFARSVFGRRAIRTMPEQLFIPPWAPLLTAWQQLTTAFVLRRLAAQAREPSFAAVCAVASMDSLRTITLRNTLHYYAARAAVTHLKAQAFVTFYEGQPWEQPAWHGAKVGNPSCVTVGYQHTVLLRHNFALQHPQDDGRVSAQPDVVLCSGPRTHALLATSHPRSTLIVFGTFRPFPAQAAVRSPRPRHRTVLVVPETGILREAKLLFEFAMRSARVMPDHHFIFRCHPIMPFERLRPHLAGSPEDSTNIEISSTRSMADDCARASVVLYRGSSSVLYAVMHGLKPVYVHQEQAQHGDPLFEMSMWRESVGSVEELQESLRAYASTSTDDASAQWRIAAEYVNAYAVPVSGVAVDQLVEAVGVSLDGARR